VIRLVINGVDADVLQTETIIGEYAIAPIGDISKRVGARSISFKLPKTANNRGIFQSCEVVTSASNIPYQRLDCRLYVDGVDMNMRFCTLEKVDGYYNIRTYGTNVSFFDLLKDKSLLALNYSDYNGFYNAERIGTTNNNDIVFPIVDFNKDSPNTYAPAVGTTISSETMLPAFKVNSILNKICNAAGYTLQNNIQTPNLIIPCNGKKVRDYDGSKYLGRFLTFTGAPLPLGSGFDPFFYFDYTASPLNSKTYWIDLTVNTRPRTVMGNPSPYTFRNLCFADEVLINFTLNFKVKTTAGSGVVRVQVITSSQTKTYTRTATSTLTTFSISDFIEVKKDANGECGLTIIFANQSGATVSLYTDSSTNFNITSCTILNPLDIRTKLQTRNFGGFRYLTPSTMLPNVKQADFIKNYLKLFSGVITVDENTKVVKLNQFNDIRNNLNNAVDWSGKVDFTDDYITDFELDYAQNNFLKYKDDDSVIKPVGTDYNAVIQNENLAVNKDLISVDFSATENVNRFSYTFPVNQIKIYENGDIANDVNMRILILELRNFAISVKNSSDVLSGSSYLIPSNIPYTRFIDTNYTNNLGFGFNIFNNYYTYIISVIDKYKIIELNVRLNLSDVSNLDFLKPVYIRELDTYFYVNKIKFDYTSKNSSVVELIKLL
jgi:hypothetical protein